MLYTVPGIPALTLAGVGTPVTYTLTAATLRALTGIGADTWIVNVHINSASYTIDNFHAGEGVAVSLTLRNRHTGAWIFGLDPAWGQSLSTAATYTPGVAKAFTGIPAAEPATLGGSNSVLGSEDIADFILSVDGPVDLGTITITNLVLDLTTVSQPLGSASGTVEDSMSFAPISGADVHGVWGDVLTDGAGHFSLSSLIPPFTIYTASTHFDFTVSAAGYAPVSDFFDLQAGGYNFGTNAVTPPVISGITERLTGLPPAAPAGMNMLGTKLMHEGIL